MDFSKIDEIDTTGKHKEKIASRIQSWWNKWTRFFKFSWELAELVGRKLEMVQCSR